MTQHRDPHPETNPETAENLDPALPTDQLSDLETDEPLDLESGWPPLDVSGLDPLLDDEGSPTRARQRRFLEHYARLGRVTPAAQMAGIHRMTVWLWQTRDEAFREAMDAVEEIARRERVAQIEEEIYRRAIKGTLRPVGFHRGEHGGTYVREYSDQLLAKLAEAEDPDRFGTRRHELTLLLATITRAIDLDALTPEQLDALARRVPPWQVFQSPQDVPLLPPAPGEDRPKLPARWPIPRDP